jgi:hypothetical protein
MGNLRRLLSMALVAGTIADPSIDQIGVRLMLNRGLEDNETCTKDEQRIVVDILEVALSSHLRGKLRAQTTSTTKAQSCFKECQGNGSKSCFFIDYDCYENRRIGASAWSEELEGPKTQERGKPSAHTISRELQDLCRERKRKVVSVLKREISSSELSGKCKGFVGGRVELACHVH